MPAYLCHGFRWHRRSIRVYVIVQNIDDAAPEWIIRRRSSRALLESFYNLFEFLPYCEPPPSPSRRRAATNASSLTEQQPFNAFAGAGYIDGGDLDDGDDRTVRGTVTPTQNRNRSRSKSRSRSRKNSSAAAAVAPPPPLTKNLPSPPMPDGQVAHDGTDDVLSQDWSAVRLLEEYDPTRLDEVSRPYAYVADYAVRIDLSVSLVEEMARYEEKLRNWPNSSSSNGANQSPNGADYNPPPMGGPYSDETGRKRQTKDRKAGWLEKLRDQLQRGEEIRWYVVVNGDEERNWPDEPPSASSRMTNPVPLLPPPPPPVASATTTTPTTTTAVKQGTPPGGAGVSSAATSYSLFPNGRGPGPGAGPGADRERGDDEQLPDQQQQPVVVPVSVWQDRAALRAQAEHHAQYTHQQRIFEDNDHRERERQKLRQQLGAPEEEEDPAAAAATTATRGGRARSESSRDRRGFGGPPPLLPPPPAPEKELPPIMVPKMSLDGGGLRPKTPKTGGFRRLFGRSPKVGADESP